MNQYTNTAAMENIVKHTFPRIVSSLRNKRDLFESFQAFDESDEDYRLKVIAGLEKAIKAVKDVMGDEA